MSILSFTSIGKRSTVAALMCANLLEGGGKRMASLNFLSQIFVGNFCVSLDVRVEEV